MSGRDLFDAVMRSARRTPPRAEPVERLVRPSLERFAAFRRSSTPVVMQGLLGDGADLEKWSLPRLRERLGERTAAMIPIDGRRMRLEVDTGACFEPVQFGDFVDRLQRGEGKDAYLIVPTYWLPELRTDLPAPEYCRNAPWQTSRFWLSAADTSSPLHHDVAENIFFQLSGRKRFYLYSPQASPWLYSNSFRSALPNFSRFDPEQADFESFPLARAATRLEVVLEPGDALYLPSRWWHQVRCLDLSASLNFWFADGLLALVVRTAELVKKTRKLEIYGLEERLRERAAA